LVGLLYPEREGLDIRQSHRWLSGDNKGMITQLLEIYTMVADDGCESYPYKSRTHSGPYISEPQRILDSAFEDLDLR